MKTETVKMLKVFYDGGCVVCNHEIDFYKKINLVWVCFGPIRKHQRAKG